MKTIEDAGVVVERLVVVVLEQGMALADTWTDSEMTASSAAVVAAAAAAAVVVDVLTLGTGTRNTGSQTEEHWDTVEHMSWIYSAQERSSWPHGWSDMPPICC